MTAPVASGWSGCRVGLAPTGKRRLSTAHTHNGRRRSKSFALRNALFDDLVGQYLQRKGNTQPECLGGFHVDYELEFSWKLNRQFFRFRSAQDAIYIRCRSAKNVQGVCSV